jgi:hypothetical protein
VIIAKVKGVADAHGQPRKASRFKKEADTTRAYITLTMLDQYYASDPASYFIAKQELIDQVIANLFVDAYSKLGDKADHDAIVHIVENAFLHIYKNKKQYARMNVYRLLYECAKKRLFSPTKIPSAVFRRIRSRRTGYGIQARKKQI